MKGRLYNPGSTASQQIAWKVPELRQSKNKILYIWDTSIPDNWHKVSQKQKIPMIKLNSKNKNSLQFLEETQKYISCITKPVDFIDSSKSLHLSPNLKETGSRSRFLSPLSIGTSHNSPIFARSLKNDDPLIIFEKRNRDERMIRLKKKMIKKRNKSKVDYGYKRIEMEVTNKRKRKTDLFENIHI